MLPPLTKGELEMMKEPKPPSKNETKKARRAEKKELKRKYRKNKNKKGKVESLKQIQEDAAGLDIGISEIWACVPEGRDDLNVRSFKTFTADLYKLAQWLGDCGVKTVAMESTGVYWIPIFEILDERGFEVNLVNARQIKNVPGKKTDILDCQWIQQLHSYGLLSASFRPDEEMAALRQLVRNRAMLIKYRAVHIQHMQKSIEMMNVKLGTVIRDITGKTGMQIVRAIVAGERDSVRLAKFRDPRCFSSEDEIAKSLEGNYKEEHMFALKQALNLYDFYSAKIEECDREIEKRYLCSAFYETNKRELPPLGKKRPSNFKNKPAYDLRSHLYNLCGVDLTEIDGIDALTAQTVVSEVGLNMDKWKSIKHFTSWLGLCPCNKITGGKVFYRGSKTVCNKASLALRVAARSLHRSKSALGAYYRRMRAKHGSLKANLAAAHKMARIIYCMLKRKEPYNDPGEVYYLEKYRSRIVNNMTRQAAALGFKLVKKAE
jgi:transposase